MLLCKGSGCQYRKTCSRYVIGKGMSRFAGCGDKWMDHCINAKRYEKYMPIHGADVDPNKMEEQP